MADLIIEVLPYAIGVFASPLPVIIAIVMLFTPRPLPTSVTYVVTWIAGLTAVTVVLLTFTLLSFASFSSTWGLRDVYVGPLEGGVGSFQIAGVICQFVLQIDHFLFASSNAGGNRGA